MPDYDRIPLCTKPRKRVAPSAGSGKDQYRPQRSAALAGSLGVGIPLWVKGRKDLDWMLDDYAKRYGPRPYAASLSAGPTRNGVGIALNF